MTLTIGFELVVDFDVAAEFVDFGRLHDYFLVIGREDVEVFVLVATAAEK